SAPAVSVCVPGEVVPNVDDVPLVTVIVIGALVEDAFLLSVTLSLALYVPAVVYVKDGFWAVESPNVPSPFRSQEYVIGSLSGSDEADPSKFTVSGAVPVVGVAAARAVGALFEPPPAGK